MPETTHHLIHVRTKHPEKSKDVAQDIANRLDSFVVEAEAVPEGATPLPEPVTAELQTLAGNPEPVHLFITVNNTIVNE